MISIVVPTYKEAPNIRPLTERIAAALADGPGEYEIVIVDDDSRDGTDAVVAELAGESHPVRLITRTKHRGLSSAVLRGFREARGEWLVCMDADLSHPPESIPALLARVADDGCDMAIGSRYVPGGGADDTWGFGRRLNSKVATLLARPFTRVKDPMSGFFCLSRTVLDRARPLNPIGYKIGLEIIVKADCRNVGEAPIHFAQRKRGQSKLTLREQFNYLRHLKALADFKYGAFSRLLQFCFVGLTGMVVDLGLYALLLAWSVPVLAGRGIAIYLAMTWNFACNRRLTFSYSRRGSWPRQYAGFVAGSALGAAISWTVSVVVAPALPMLRGHLMISAVLGILCGTVSNFLVSLRFVFRRRVVTDEADPAVAASRERIADDAT